MNKLLKLFMQTTCVSYTFVIILQTLLFHYNHQNMTNELNIIIFIICLIINLLINVTYYLELAQWLTNILSIIEIVFVVCTANYLSGYTNCIIELDNFIGVLFMSVTVYFLVIGIVFMKNSEDAKKINKKLKRNRDSN